MAGVQHNKRISADENFQLTVAWTRDDEPVTITDARLVITDSTETDFDIATLGDGISVTDGEIVVDVDYAVLPSLAAGPGSYVLAVKDGAETPSRLVEGGLSIQRMVVTW